MANELPAAAVAAKSSRRPKAPLVVQGLILNDQVPAWERDLVGGQILEVIATVANVQQEVRHVDDAE